MDHIKIDIHIAGVLVQKNQVPVLNVWGCNPIIASPSHNSSGKYGLSAKQNSGHHFYRNQ